MGDSFTSWTCWVQKTSCLYAIFYTHIQGFPRRNINMIIISPQVFTYILSHWCMHSSVLGVSGGHEWLPKDLVLLSKGGEKLEQLAWFINLWILRLMKSCSLFLTLDNVSSLMVLQIDNCINPPVQTILHLATMSAELYDLEWLLILFNGWNRAPVLSYSFRGAGLPETIWLHV